MIPDTVIPDDIMRGSDKRKAKWLTRHVMKGRRMVCNIDQYVADNIQDIVLHYAAMHKSLPMEGIGDKIRWWDQSKPCTTRSGCTAGSGHPPPHNIQGTGHTGGQTCDKCGGGLCEMYDQVHSHGESPVDL